MIFWSFSDMVFLIMATMKKKTKKKKTVNFSGINSISTEVFLLKRGGDEVLNPDWDDLMYM